MEHADWGLILSVLAGAASIIWQASRIKASVDTHGNAIGEMKRRMDASDKAISEHLS